MFGIRPTGSIDSSCRVGCCSRSAAVRIVPGRRTGACFAAASRVTQPAQAGFDKISHAAARAAKALRNGGRRRFVDLAAAMRADWEARKQMDHRLAPNELLRLEKVGVEAGAWAAKGCGAAAGGCMLFLLKRATDRDRVQRALTAAGASMVPMTIAASGLRVRSG